MPQRLLPLVLCSSLLLAIGGCNTVPTLPLPPPVAMVGEPNSQGLVLVEGQVSPRAFVSVFNERSESGVITRADLEGYFTAELAAVSGDLLTIWQEIEGETGERKQVMVPDPQ